jgi:hypothetical protein
MAGRSPGFALTARRFPPPWTVEEQEACFIVQDNDGQQLDCHRTVRHGAIP